ncbi:MAG: type II secretion system F family protein, partial [Candidatus Yanofskybacteria bacterium]|nr:type II secretion system F family protein [Candidatus Yanofskybacteria bacterium]
MDFLYQAKNQTGDLVSGRIEAPNEDQAVSVLHQKNLVVLSLAQASRGFLDKDIFAFIQRPTQKDLVLFTRQLATLVEADIPLVEGLQTLSRQTEKEAFRRVIQSISSSIEGGATLSVALNEHSRIFGRFFISLVRAGEVSGKLQTTLLYLADYLERSSALVSKIRGALAYPAFVFFAMILVTAIIFTTVLPQLLSIIKDAGVQEIPLTTRILITVTDFVNQFLILIIIVLLVAIICIFYYAKSPQGRFKWDSTKIHIPQFGKVIRSFYLARIAETLSTLIKAGVPILEGLSITSDVAGN